MLLGPYMSVKIFLKMAVQIVPIPTSNLSVFVKQLKCADNDRKYVYRTLTMKDLHVKIVKKIFIYVDASF
jgi:hypothetical protein